MITTTTWAAARSKLWRGQRPDLRWVTSLGVAAGLIGFGVRPDRITELDWTERCTIKGSGGAQLEVISAPARHFSGRFAWNRNETLWASFVLSGSAHRVYCGGDTGLWDGLPAIAEAYGPFDLAMIEIGAFHPLWHQIHLGPDGAVTAFEALGATALMPVHWGLFNLALHGWREPIERVSELADQKGICLFQPTPGEPAEFVQGVPLRSGWWR